MSIASILRTPKDLGPVNCSLTVSHTLSNGMKTFTSNIYEYRLNPF